MRSNFRKLGLVLTISITLSFSALFPLKPSGAMYVSSHQNGSEQYLYSRTLKKTLPIRDVRDEDSKISKGVPHKNEEEREFLLSKIRLVRSNHSLSDEEQEHAIKTIKGKSLDPSNVEETAPDPTGSEIGFGDVFTTSFRYNFYYGTALEYTILCPPTPGGNVSTYLYLTSTNRASMGVEAFVSYEGQSAFLFKVFDWARSDPWQTVLSQDNLSPYLTTKTVGGISYQALHILNNSDDIGGGFWSNRVYLLNYLTNGWDYVYSYDYEASTGYGGSQQTSYLGWWGPIIEVFQAQYSNLNPMGFADCDIWGDGDIPDNDPYLIPWKAYLQGPSHGLQTLYLQPNYTFTAH